jgi:hypothetical protein
MAKGIGASPGIAIAKAFILPALEWELSDVMIDVADLAVEFEKLYDGIRSSKVELQHIKQDIFDLIGEEESNIFDAHLAILEDPIFMNEVQGLMQRQYKAAEVAVKETIDKFVGMFELLDEGTFSGHQGCGKPLIEAFAWRPGRAEAAFGHPLYFGSQGFVSLAAVTTEYPANSGDRHNARWNDVACRNHGPGFRNSFCAWHGREAGEADLEWRPSYH